MTEVFSIAKYPLGDTHMGLPIFSATEMPDMPIYPNNHSIADDPPLLEQQILRILKTRRNPPNTLKGMTDKWETAAVDVCERFTAERIPPIGAMGVIEHTFGYLLLEGLDPDIRAKINWGQIQMPPPSNYFPPNIDCLEAVPAAITVGLPSGAHPMQRVIRKLPVSERREAIDQVIAVRSNYRLYTPEVIISDFTDLRQISSVGSGLEAASLIHDIDPMVHLDARYFLSDIMPVL
jgi:hypothetical protein